MTSQPADSTSDFESRLYALEASVAKLVSIIEPVISASNVAAPVTTAILKEAAEHAYSARSFALLDLGETILKYSAAFAFTSTVQNGGPQAEVVMEMFRQPPTLGILAEELRKILDDQSNAVWPLDILRPVFRKPNNKPTPTARYLFEEFIHLRNHERGHGLFRVPKSAQD